MEKRPFFRAATAGLGKYGKGGYGRSGSIGLMEHRYGMFDNQSRITLQYTTVKSYC